MFSCRPGHPKSLEDFTYNDSDIGDVMLESMASVDFQGVLGRMMFDEHGDPSSITALDQQQGMLSTSRRYILKRKVRCSVCQ